MQFDLMTGNLNWARSAELAKLLDEAGFSGMLFTEAGSVPWMQICSASQAAPSLEFSTGIAVAFPPKPDDHRTNRMGISRKHTRQVPHGPRQPG